MKVIPNFRPNPAKFVAFLAAMRTEVLILFARSFGVLLVLSVFSGCLVERLDVVARGASISFEAASEKGN